MIRTPSTAVLAERAVIYANAARAGHKRHKPLTRKAINLVALCLVQEIRRSGGHVSRKHEQSLRRQ